MRNLICTLALSMCLSLPAHAAESEPLPIPVTVETLRGIIVAEVSDVKKLETKVVALLRKRYGYTLAEARALVRVDGKTNVRQCLSYLYIDVLGKITVATVTYVTTGLEVVDPAEQPVPLPE